MQGGYQLIDISGIEIDSEGYPEGTVKIDGIFNRVFNCNKPIVVKGFPNKDVPQHEKIVDENNANSQRYVTKNTFFVRDEDTGKNKIYVSLNYLTSVGLYFQGRFAIHSIWIDEDDVVMLNSFDVNGG